MDNKRVTLESNELYDVLNLPVDKAMDLFILGEVDLKHKTLTLTRGDFKTLKVPFEIFNKSGNSPEPEFDKFRLIDYGQTIQLGKDYEAAGDGVLYEMDLEYRKRNKWHDDSEDSFGDSIKRLRMIKGRSQDDCQPFSKEDMIAFESNSVEASGVDKYKLATLFKVAPNNLGTF